MLNAAFLDLPYLFLVIHTATLVNLFKIRLLQLSNPYLPNSHDTNTLLFWKGGTGLVWLLEPNEDTYFKQKSFTVLLSAVLSILGKDQFMHRYTPLRLGICPVKLLATEQTQSLHWDLKLKGTSVVVTRQGNTGPSLTNPICPAVLENEPQLSGHSLSFLICRTVISQQGYFYNFHMYLEILCERPTNYKK